MNVTPWTAPESFAEDIWQMSDRAEEAGLDILVPALEEDYASGFAVTPAMAAAVAAIMTNAEIRRVWERAGRRSNEASLRHWLREARRVGIIDDITDPELPERLRRRWESEQQDRFRKLRDHVRRETEAKMRADREANVRAATTAAAILAIGLPTFNGRLRGRGRVIASDQLETLGGLIARTQQVDAGLEFFIWTTRGDDRVRDAHAALNKKRFRWEKPPPVGHPGIPIACRCIAIGVVDGPADET